MKATVTFATVLMLLVCTGCGDSSDAVAKDTVSVMEEMVSIMEGVKDEASAKKANEKLRALGDKFKDLKARQDNLNLSAKDKAELEEKYKAKMEPVIKKLFSEGMRISMDPQLKPALDGLDNMMK